MEEKFKEYISIMINSRHTKGQILEKTSNFERAVREYMAGAKLAEVHLETTHSLYIFMTDAQKSA